MTKLFFFDDQRLFDRQGLERRYGEPEPLEMYSDPNIAIAYCWSWVLKGPDGLYHLIYSGLMKDKPHIVFAAAISEDGIHFRPRNTAAEAGITNPLVPNQLLDFSCDGEIAAIVDDPLAPPETRYKILFTGNDHLYDKYMVEDYVFTSPDLIHFTKLEDSCWNPVGTEPAAGAFYNPVRKCYSILARPDWGQRRVGYTETTDWHHFTDLELCLQCDSSDKPLAEIYGMPALHYDGIFVGFPLVYSSFKKHLSTKFYTGTMEAELAYSLNGRYWQRSLRKPFLGIHGPQQRFLPKISMIWPSTLVKADNERMFLYASVNTYEHGTPAADIDPLKTGMMVFSLRNDGFVGLFTDLNGHEGSFATRELVWQGGDPVFNLQAGHATCAVYEAESNLAKEPTVLEGFAHEDCVPFSGDSTAWKPQWKNGASLETVARGKVVVVELRLADGAVWSLQGDFCPVMNIEAERYRAFGQLPNRPGF